MKASALKTSSLKQGLRSSFSSGGGFSLSGLKVAKNNNFKNNQNLGDLSQVYIDDSGSTQDNNDDLDLATDKEKLSDTLEITQDEIKPAALVQNQESFTQPNSPEPVLEISQAEKLDTLDEIISEIEKKKEDQLDFLIDSPASLGTIAQVTPQTFNQANLASMPVSQTNKKEALASINSSTELNPDWNGGVQVVEQEKNPEIPPEVESFLHHAEDHAAKLPEEIVIADNQEISKTTHYPKTPVLVLPITQEEEDLGKNKNPKFSLRWLVEWSYKMMKKFSGKVVYRMDE